MASRERDSIPSDTRVNTHDAALFLPKWADKMELLESMTCKAFSRAEQIADNLPASQIKRHRK